MVISRFEPRYAASIAFSYGYCFESYHDQNFILEHKECGCILQECLRVGSGAI